MNILIITPVGDYRGGAERSLLETVKILLESGHKLIVVTSNTGDFTDEIKNLGVKIVTTGVKDEYIVIGKKNFFPALFLAVYTNFRLFYLIKKNSIDLIYIHTSGIFPWVFITIFLLNLNHIIVQERSGKPNVLIRWLYRFLGKRLIVIFNSKFMKDTYHTVFVKVPWKEDYVLYPPIDLETFAPKSEEEKLRIRSQLELKVTDFLIVYVGRICRSKQIHHIIEAIDFIPEPERIHIAIVGKASNKDEVAYEKFLLEEIHRRKRGKNVHFLGFRKDTALIMSSADLLVLPSNEEPFGRAIIEAQACGTPVIAADSGGAIEAIDYELGLTFETGNIKDLAEKISKILDYKKSFSKREYVERVRKHLLNKAGISQYRKNLLLIINQI